MCEECSPGCKNCESDNFCSQCQSGYYIENNICNECLPNCQNCNNKITCELCQSGYHIHEQTNQCVICSQQLGYYISGKYCKQCNVACKECSGPTDLDCTICNQFYFQIDTTTKRCQTCPNNAYLNSSNFKLQYAYQGLKLIFQLKLLLSMQLLVMRKWIHIIQLKIMYTEL
ncbi:variant specific surface protein S2, putative (macronuclear) [Tetrahymena thermophila SB210]|uniref:Variant specific surface protein S2, putative n=1 Tax=Tetrahymena thermophila (strain SB210) TaxID=312017 RepID=W7XEM8_TETTS|nr:variant specific surface protein S2, putative [Tetrahymena thermophila SB210]EWS76207.1 variant specific surface protein S2, putative [Tetrahymena thermophila SB210]|eukprot:XP_012651254.1 variant specific surface protein S2, putative [Tetrahymena thermophila SB210]